MGRLVPRVRERLDEVERLGAWKAGCGVDELLETALALEPSATVALVHGDLHVRHLLVGDTGAAGVIDWGDMCLADPSVDLQIGWSAFSGSARSAFLDAYGPVPDGRAVRAQVLALHLSALLVIYAQHEGLAAVEREALGGLTRAVT
jgi:aminoglycoside phosphotransferase (APT) family kinase protein